MPLARLKKRVFTTAEKLEAGIEVAHFGPAPMENALTTWTLVSDQGTVRASGTLPLKTVAVDNAVTLGTVRIDLRNVPAPARYKLVVRIGQDSRSVFQNDWDLWIYPPKVDTAVPAGITVADDWNDAVLARPRGAARCCHDSPRPRTQ